MGAPNSKQERLRHIAEIERQCQRLAPLKSPEARDDLGYCKRACVQAREALEREDDKKAEHSIRDAQTFLSRAARGERYLYEMQEKITTALLRTLPQARRRVFERRYPNLAAEEKRLSRRK